MADKLKYFIFNKEWDYQRGFLENMDFDSQGIQVRKDCFLKATFISRVLDSKEFQMNWHRMTLECNEKNNSPYKISIFSSDKNTIIHEGHEKKVEDLILDQEISTKDKLTLFEPYLQKEMSSTGDILLHEVKGRYLWIAIEMLRHGGKRQTKIHNIQIFFPKQTWMEYLPEIYQKEDTNEGFLERYLAIFQTLYEDLNFKINDSANLFDVDTTQKEYLLWLAEWFDMEQSYVWTQSKLRKLLKNAVKLYRARGTKDGIREFAQLYTGKEPYLLEYFQLKRADSIMGNELRSVRKDFGLTPNSFCLIVNEEEVPTVKEQKTLARIVESVKPAHLEMKMVIIKPYLFLGQHSYLGINSVLANYRPIELGKGSYIQFSTIGDSNNRLGITT